MLRGCAGGSGVQAGARSARPARMVLCSALRSLRTSAPMAPVAPWHPWHPWHQAPSYTYLKVKSASVVWPARMVTVCGAALSASCQMRSWSWPGGTSFSVKRPLASVIAAEVVGDDDPAAHPWMCVARQPHDPGSAHRLRDPHARDRQGDVEDRAPRGRLRMRGVQHRVGAGGRDGRLRRHHLHVRRERHWSLLTPAAGGLDAARTPASVTTALATCPAALRTMVSSMMVLPHTF